MGQITYADKSAINVNPDIADTNKVNASDMNEIKTEVNDNYSKITGVQGEILWTNPNPTSNFGSQTITLSSGDYDVLEWYICSSTSGNYLFTEKSIKNFGISSTFIVEINQGVNQYTGFIQRNIKYATDTTYNVANCLSRRNASQSTPTIDNGYMIPLYVIGYKKGLF